MYIRFKRKTLSKQKTNLEFSFPARDFIQGTVPMPFSMGKKTCEERGETKSTKKNAKKYR